MASTYEMALVRYGVLITMVNAVSVPLSAGLMLLYIWLALSMLSTVFAHRRPQYGLLMTYGATTWGVSVVIFAQIILAAIIGGVFGRVVPWRVIEWFNDWMSRSSAIDAAQNTIGLDGDAFLSDLPAADAAIVWLALTLLALIVGGIILWFNRVFRAKAPIDLLKLS